MTSWPGTSLPGVRLNAATTAYWPVGNVLHLLTAVPPVRSRLCANRSPDALAFTLVLIMTLAATATAAVAAGALFAFWPMQIEFTSVMASELIFNLLTLFALWLALEAPFRSTLVRVFVVGLVLAADSYVRVHALLSSFLLIPGGAHLASEDELARSRDFHSCGRPDDGRLHRSMDAPQQRVLGEPFLIASNGGAATWAGNNPQSTGECMPFPDDVTQLSEADRDRVLSARTKSFIRENPGRFIQLSAQRLFLTYNRETMGIVWNEDSLSRYVSPSGIMAAKIVSTLYWLGALALAISGLV